jgi:metal-dependent hydrolase (beta-lactamase superfamily II)
MTSKTSRPLFLGHLYLDHAGGLEHFMGTDVPIYVHEEEFQACLLDRSHRCRP